MPPILVKERLWPALGYVPHALQAEVHNSTSRHRRVSAGRRVGKSVLGGHELTTEALYTHTIQSQLEDENKHRRFWIVGPNYDDAEREWRVFYDDMKKLKAPWERPGTYNDPRGGNMMMTLWGGRFVVECRSADHPESLDGEGLSGVILVEAAKMKSTVWSKYIRPALADYRGWSLGTTTPEGRNWFYDQWVWGQDPDRDDWGSWRAPSWANDVVFPGGRDDPEIIELSKDMSEAKFNQEIGAEFTEFVGRVFKRFEEEVHVKNLAYDARYPLYLAVDYGFTNPFVCLLVQVDTWDNIYVLGEYRVTHTDINDIARDLLSWKDGLATKARLMYPDPASPGDTRVLEKALRVRARGGTGGPIKERLELIRQALKPTPEHLADDHPDKQPRLFIDRSCADLIAEMGDKYRYPENKSDERAEKEEPMKVDDHGPEALGRFFVGHYGQLGKQDNRARVSRANVSSGNRRTRISA